MLSLREQLTNIVGDAVSQYGWDRKYGKVTASDRPDLSQFQCNGALAIARENKISPRLVAQLIVDTLSSSDVFHQVSIDGPGFINLKVRDEYLVANIQKMSGDKFFGRELSNVPLRIVVDYGGANIAKPLHVGHLRAAIIGESLKRLARLLGHEVLGDIHMGDWGLQMGIVISELERRHPDWKYFTSDANSPYPSAPPVTIVELEEIYPAVSAQAKQSPFIMEEARRTTYQLQQGFKGYYALWKDIRDVSIADLREDYSKLNVNFDLWLGESDTQGNIPSLLETLQAEGYAYESQGALVIDVTQPGDKRDVPPFMLVKSDGAILYSTTDLATIQQRVKDYNPDLILYVVDKRQADHFWSLFRAAHKTGIAPATLKMEHVPFGTMNGRDGKPFKTRAGGVMKLKDLIESITRRALEQMNEADIAKDYSENEKANIAQVVGVAALKYADLMNHPSTDYVFDLDRFSSFEGHTGPYILYTAVRIKSILRKAMEQGISPGQIALPINDVERKIFLKFSELPELLIHAFEDRAPNCLCEYAYDVAALVTRFYHDYHILGSNDDVQQKSWLRLCILSVGVLELMLDLLGIGTLERM